MKNILTIFKKEIDRVFKDKRLIVTLFILPGLFIFVIYTIMGTAFTNMSEDETTNIAIVNPTDTFESIYTSNETINETFTNLNIIEISEAELDNYKEMINNQDWTILIIFSEDIENYDGSGENPVVTFYSNPKDLTMSIERFRSYLMAYDEFLQSSLYGDTSYINFDFQQSPVSEKELIGTIMSSLLPMLVIMFLFSGAMSIGPESIAGEKDRNTISTLLITPIKRSELAIGKILSLSVLSLISAVSSFIGIILSLPKLLNLGDAGISVFSMSDYFLILMVLFSTIFVIIGIVATVSAYARSLKEANTYIAPIYILTILISITSMFNSGASSNIFVYLVPIYNAVQSLVAIMTFESSAPLYVLVTFSANTVYLIGFIYLLNLMFKSEKIMFKK